MFLCLPLLFLLHKVFVQRRHKAPTSHGGLDKPIPLQVLIGFLDGDDAHMYGFGQGTHGRDGLAGGQFPTHDLGLDLGRDLFVDRLAVVAADDDFQLTSSPCFGVLIEQVHYEHSRTFCQEV